LLGEIQGKQSFMSFSGIKLRQDQGHQTINATPYTPSSGVAFGVALKSTPLGSHAFRCALPKARPTDGCIVVQGCPGLRLEASAAGKSWVYRYKSQVGAACLLWIELGARLGIYRVEALRLADGMY
jgi:hypothetical protein